MKYPNIDAQNRILSSEKLDVHMIDNVVIGVFKVSNVDLDSAIEVVKLRIQACNNKSYPLLVDIRLVKSFDKGARDYIANEGTQLVEATAILTNSAITKTLANFYMKISKPMVPTRVFTNEAEAFTWLQQFKS